jgi:hypothetical protein
VLHRAGRVLLLTVLAAGCSAQQDPLRDECAGHFAWKGVEYDGLGPDPHVHPHGSDVLGRGGVRGCENELVSPGDVVRLAGVDPRVAVGLEPDDPQAGFGVFGRPGYVIDSAAHPAHRFVYDDPARPRWRIGYACGPRMTLRVVATNTPRGSYASFMVRGVRPRDRRALRAARWNNVRIPGDVRVSGLMRHGAPYLAGGDRVTVTVRACKGLEKDEPVGYKRTGRTLIADAISR